MKKRRKTNLRSEMAIAGRAKPGSVEELRDLRRQVAELDRTVTDLEHRNGLLISRILGMSRGLRNASLALARLAEAEPPYTREQFEKQLAKAGL